jgi:uncharacterized membrane protein
MKSILRFFQTTLLGGALFLVPIVVLIFLVGKILDLAHKVADPVAEQIPLGSVMGVKMPVLVSIIVVVMVCFVAGIISRGVLMKKFIETLENWVLSNIPGYQLLKSTSESMLGLEDEQGHTPVFVRFDDEWQIGLKVDELENGLVAVFIPDAPVPRAGTLLFLPADRVIPTDVQLTDALKCVKDFGGGSKELFRNVQGGGWPSSQSVLGR